MLLELLISTGRFTTEIDHNEISEDVLIFFPISFISAKHKISSKLEADQQFLVDINLNTTCQLTMFSNNA